MVDFQSAQDTADDHFDDSQHERNAKQASGEWPPVNMEFDPLDDAAARHRSDFMTVNEIEPSTRPTTEIEELNTRWQRVLDQMHQQFQAESPRYRHILNELNKAPTGLAGNLNEQIAALAHDVRTAQATVRNSRIEAAHKIRSRVEMWIDEKLPVIFAAIDPELYPPDGEPDAELSAIYAEYADEGEWPPAKREALHEYLRYWLEHDRYDTDKNATKRFPWLKEQRNRLEQMHQLEPDLRDILNTIRKKIEDAAALGIIYNSRKEGARYVELIKRLDVMRREGVLIGYEVDQRGDYRTDRDGNPVTYDVLRRLSETQIEYAEYCLRVANDKLFEGTGLTLPQWRDGAMGLKHNVDLAAIDIALRTGLINRDPARQSLPDYQYINITTDLSIPPDKVYLQSEQERKDFDDVLVALDAALNLATQVKQSIQSRQLGDLYRFVLPYYNNQTLLGEVRRFEDRETEMLRNEMDALSEIAPEMREASAFQALRQRIDESPFNLVQAPGEKRDAIEDLLKEYTQLERETRLAQTRFQEAQSQLNTFEGMLTTTPPNLLAARGIFTNLQDQLTQNANFLTTAQRSRLDRLINQLTSLEGFDSVFSETVRRYAAALVNRDNAAAWRAVLEYSKLHFSDEDMSQAGSKHQRDEGRKVYLHAVARDSFLRALERPYIDPNARQGESREELLAESLDAIRQLEQVLALLNQHEDDVQTLKEVIAADREDIKVRRETMAGVLEVAERARTYYTDTNYFARDYVAAYRLIDNFHDEGTASEGGKAEHLNKLAASWVEDTEKIVRQLVGNNTSTQVSGQSSAVRDQVEAQLKMLDDHLTFFDSNGYMITPAALNSYRVFSNNAWQHVFNEKHLDTNSQPLDTEFRLPLAHADYLKWYDLVGRLPASQIRQHQQAEVAAYVMLSWLINGATTNSLNLMNDLKTLINNPSYFSALPTQIADAPLQANRLLFYDALLLLQTRHVIEQYRNRANISSDTILRDQLSVQLKEARAYYQQLVYAASTPAANQLARLWSEWLAVLEAYLGNNMSYALQKIEEIVGDPVPTTSDGDLTGWLNRRIVYIREEARGIRNNVQTIVSNELRNASFSGGRPEDFARLAEFAFLLLKVNSSAIEAKNVINNIIRQMPVVYNYYVAEIKNVLDSYLPISIHIAVEKMSSLVAKIDLNSRGFRTDIGLQFLQTLQRGGGAPIDTMFTQLSEQANALNGALVVAQTNYEATRRTLYGILRNEAGFNTSRSWNWGSFEQKFGDLNTALVGITTLVGNSFGHHMTVDAIKWFKEVEQLGKDIMTQIKLITQYDNAINDAINRQNDYDLPDSDDSPRRRYDKALDLLGSTRTAINTIAERIREHGTSVFAGFEEFAFTLPNSFFITPLPQNITIPRQSSDSEVNITRLEGVAQHDDILKRLRQQAQVWETWVDTLIRHYDMADTQNRGLQAWHQHFDTLRQEVFSGAWIDYTQIQPYWEPLQALFTRYAPITDPKYDTLNPTTGARGVLDTFEETIGALHLIRNAPSLVIPPDMLHLYHARLWRILDEQFFQEAFDRGSSMLAEYLDRVHQMAQQSLAKLRYDIEFVDGYVYMVDYDIAEESREIARLEAKRRNKQEEGSLSTLRADLPWLYQVRAVLTAAERNV